MHDRMLQDATVDYGRLKHMKVNYDGLLHIMV